MKTQRRWRDSQNVPKHTLLGNTFQNLQDMQGEGVREILPLAEGGVDLFTNRKTLQKIMSFSEARRDGIRRPEWFLAGGGKAPPF